jgi:wobble nucleotide-excising tRNase
MLETELGNWPLLVTAIDELIAKLEKQRQETNYWKSRAAELERLNSFSLNPLQDFDGDTSSSKNIEQLLKERKKAANIVKQILAEVIKIETAIKHKQDKPF